ncbi:MAG: hypothetical protein KGJ23_11885 [Euryarchaeota archaeon]|nr:hypothetical protein [Euryarchaeota archaeon]MDE1837296.1 hypothetical protein [Euryarchaeota archaeon]MDE1879832.1 hypothetical protein [Euryarchaeota archaeon]MDE2045273.1 hypothetical protein [Thermoplasmata archaeon]
MILVARRQELRSSMGEGPDLPSWLTFDLQTYGFSRVGYLGALLKDHPQILRSRELGVVDLSRLRDLGVDLGAGVLRALNMDEGSGFVWSRDPAYLHNERLVVGELENATFGVYLKTGDPTLLKALDRALDELELPHTDRWTIYLERAKREFAKARTVTGATELTLDEPLPISLRAEGKSEKSPLLKLVESLVKGYLGYLPREIKERLLHTGCAFVPNMRLLLKQFPQLALDQNVLKIDFFSGESGRNRGNRRARKLLGLEPGNGWILIRDARREIEHNLSEALKARFEEEIRSVHARTPLTVEKVQLSTLLNEHGVGCTFDRDNRKSRKLGWTTLFSGTERTVLGAAALDELGLRDTPEVESRSP